MNKLNYQAVLLAGLASFTSLAQAGPTHSRIDSSHMVHAKVLEVRPVYREVRISVPVEECWQEPVTRHHHVEYGGNRTAATLAGGLLGGIIGHQFGKGRGQKVSTALGTIIGAHVGHDALGRSGHGKTTTYTSYERQCSQHQQVSYEQQLDGYQVTYRHGGKDYTTQMPYDPGDRIKLKVTVSPVF